MELENIGREVVNTVKGKRTVIVTDKNVEKLYLEKCKKSLEDAGIETNVFVVEPGEESKSAETYIELINFLAEIPLTRTDFLVALGGGVVGDLTGFAAATYLRGIEVVQVPTTVLAAVDSSVGGKTAINLKAGKNLVGAFHQPVLVVQDCSTLDTLPKDIYRDGMAEVIKYGIIEDEKLFEYLKDKDKTEENISVVVDKCVEIKKIFVEEDEFDKGIRQLLNFGHTIGHAIEKASDFEISHGNAVAKGMHLITKISAEKGWCDASVSKEVDDILTTYGFELTVPYEKEILIDTMLSDKKRKGDYIDLVIPERIGKCVLKRVTTTELKELL